MCQLWPFVQAPVILLPKRQAKGHILNQKGSPTRLHMCSGEQKEMIRSCHKGFNNRNDTKQTDTHLSITDFGADDTMQDF